MILITRWRRLSLSVLAASALIGIFSSGLAASVLIGMVTSGCSRAASEPEQPRGVGQALDDVRTTTSVKIALAFEPGVSSTAIHVDTDRGVVTLRGEVRTEAERQLALRVAEDAATVKEVVNQLRVRG